MVLTLALGIGANTAVFSVLNAVILSPLPFPDADRLVRMPVSSEFFEVLGTPPVRGRSFSREEERGGIALAVINYGLWQRRFGGGEDALGRTLQLDDVPHEIIGIMPRGFQGPLGRPVEVWTPENLDLGASRNSTGNHYLSAVGRLAPGVTVAQARDRMEVVARTIAEGYDSEEGTWIAQIVPLHEDRVGESRATLWVLMAAVALVLLSTYVNVANLFLVRSLSRAREMAVRASLGAGRNGLVRQLLSESLLLSVLGGLLGLFLAWAGIKTLVGMSPEGLPRISEIGLNGPVLGFTLAVSLLTGIVFGLAPMLRFSPRDLGRDLRDGERGSTGGRHHRRLRSVLVVSEVGVALVLLVGAGVLLQSFEALRSVDLAIDPEGTLTYEVHLPSSRYPSGADRVRFYDELFPRVASIPGVHGIGATSWLPVQGRYHDWGVSRKEGDEFTGDWNGADMRMVVGDYFDVLGVDLIQGRFFGPDDREGSDPVCIINEFVRDRDFPGEVPIGKPLYAAGVGRTVVGVVENTPHDPFGGHSPKVYIPHVHFADNRNWSLIQTVSVDGDPLAFTPRIREELRGVDPNLVL